MMAPAKIPLNIMGIVILTSVLNLLAPRDSAASSMEIGICDSMATEDLMVYGILLTHMAMTMIAAVPTSGRYRLLNARIMEIPTTAPGMTYGTIERVSIVALRTFLRLTVRYEIRIAMTMIRIRAMPQMRMVFHMVLPILLNTCW